jgi:hypothetical protein
MQVTSPQGEQPITIDDSKNFVSKSDVAAGERATAYEIEAPDDYVIGVDAGTIVAPYFRTSSGDPVDGSVQILMQKADPQRNPLGNAIIFEDTMSVFDQNKMRTDEDYYRFTHKPLLLDEREFLFVYLEVPSNADDFSASDSRLTIGDKSTRKNQPAYIRETGDLRPAQQQAVSQASGGR